MKATDVVLTVGNSLMGDDGAGPLLAEIIEREPVPGWVVIDGGAMPENVIRHVRALAPRRVLIVDAAEIGVAPGGLRFVEKEQIAEMFAMSTHNMPLSFIMDELERDVEDVVFLGVQPEAVEFCRPISEAVRQAVRRIHKGLAQGLSDIPWLA
ncbi:MAG: hydrogenase maturation peptidase HycI [Deltaproteobacteria bacterium]|jgi:hydrogenase 3 maturation protease|nr:hydrogenase maturation peptidase HycI [Deltaproteobacteria bacterium]